MQVYDYLENLKKLKIKERKLLEEINNIKLSLLPGGISYDRDKVDTSPVDRYSKAFARIDELEGELDRLQAIIFDTKQNVIKMTRILPVKEKAVILSYYNDDKTICDIAALMGITERHAFRLKENGISMLNRGIG